MITYKQKHTANLLYVMLFTKQRQRLTFLKKFACIYDKIMYEILYALKMIISITPEAPRLATVGS